MIDPYVFAIGTIGIVFAMGFALVKRIYDRRTHTPSVDTDVILKKIIPQPPDDE